MQTKKLYSFILENVTLRNFFLILSTSLLLAIFVRNSYLFQFQGSNSYGLTEWLVNYEAGFVRRGLAGEIFKFFFNNFNIKVNYIVLILCVILYLYLLFYILIKTKKIFPKELILSTLVMGMPIYTEFFIRKDILGIILLITSLKILNLNINKIQYFLIINIFLSLCVLINETFIFYSFPAIILFAANKKNFSHNYLKNLIVSLTYIMPSIFVLFFIIIYHHNPEAGLILHNSYQELWISIDPKNCCIYEFGGEFKGLSNNLKSEFLGFFKFIYNYTFNFFIWIIIIISTFILLLNFLENKSNYKKKIFAKILIFQFISILPLFIVAGDWGRWIFFWSTSSIILYLFNFNLSHNYLNFLDLIVGKILTFKIFKVKFPYWILLLIGIPMVHYQWTLYHHFMTSPGGKFLAIVYKLYNQGLSAYF